MSDTTEDFFEKAGGSAFPIVAEGGNDSGLHPELQPGMTLRDYFAGQAIAGMCPVEKEFVIATAQRAYALADAMLAARR